MMNIAAVVLFSQLGFGTLDVVVARPEVPTIVRVGQTLVIPLYDGEIGPRWHEFAAGLQDLGERRIAAHSLRRDMPMVSAFGGYEASSERGEAFLVKGSGGGSVNVTLRLPEYKDRCVSCRTVHFFYRTE
jgi:hypothetical protein